MLKCMHVLKKSNASKGKLYTFPWRKRILQPEGMWLKILLLSFYDLGTLVHWLKEPRWESRVRIKIIGSHTCWGWGAECKGGERVVPVACPHQSLRQAPSNSIFKFEIPCENLPQKNIYGKKQKTKTLKTSVFSPLTCMSLQMLSFYIAENTSWRSKRAHLPQVPN